VGRSVAGGRSAGRRRAGAAGDPGGGGGGGGARFSAPVQTGPRAHSASYRVNTGSNPGVNRPGRGADCPPHLAPRLKKWYSHTVTLPLGFHGVYSGEPSHAVFNSVTCFTGLWNLPSPTSKEAQCLRRIRGPRRREVTED